jgi:predicted TIM-barrel fold metal-dependent hydrolase
MPLPLVDAHAHFYQVTRPGGVEWPPRGSGALDRDYLVSDYEAVARPLGVVGVVVVEASPLPADTQWMLEHAGGHSLFRALVAELDVDAPDAPARLAAHVEDPRIAGVRAFLWTGAIELDEEQLGLLRTLSDSGMTLDLISRGEKNPKPGIVRLARAVPELRIVVDHLAGADGRVPSPAWVAALRSLAACPNVHLKLSAIFDLFNPGPNENVAWESPLDVDAYRAHFDLVLETFGADRVLFGSNWPVTEMSGSLANAIRIVESYLWPLGRSVRDRVMLENAERFYSRRRPA